MISDLSRIIDQVGKDKGIDKGILIEALEQALLAAARKKYGPKQEIEAKYNEDAGEVELFQFKTVVKDVKNPPAEISLAEAKELDAEAQIGDSLGTKIDVAEFGRIAAKTAKQVIGYPPEIDALTVDDVNLRTAGTVGNEGDLPPVR